MDSKFAEVAMCGGFFIIYFIDEFIHYFFGEAIQHTHSQEPETQPVRRPNNGNGSGYGAVGERAPLLSAEPSSHGHSHHHNDQ